MDLYVNKIAERLGGKKFGTSMELYKFEKIKRTKAEVRKHNPQTELIDLGAGEPDKPGKVFAPL